MKRHAAIIGGSVGGLGAGIALARRGWEVTIVERDDTSPTDDGDEAFVAWDRRHVPQFRQPHAFSARSRNLLLEHAPEAVERMVADGIEEVNLFKLLAPAEMWTAADDAYTGLWSRRPAFELALRRTAEVEPGVNLISPGRVAGLVTEGTAPVRVTGIRLVDGPTLAADLVIDAAGRRSPVPAWLAELGVEVPATVQDCGAVYHARYYRRNPASGMPPLALLGVREFLHGLAVIGFPGDHDTYGLGLFVPDDDPDFGVARQDWAWDALMAALPTTAAWASPDVGTPLTGVQFMSGHQNVRRQFVVDDRPLVHGLLPVGDSLCATNPMYGWGASMALTYAFAAVGAACEHDGDPEAVALAYDAAVAGEADDVYRESAAMDRLRDYEWRGEGVPAWDQAEVDRQRLIMCIAAGALKDPVLGRAQLRRMNLLEAPGAVLDDPEVVERARHTQTILASKPMRRDGLTRAGLLETVLASRR